MLQPVMVRFPAEMLQQIDDIAADRLDRPERSGVIRELIAEALHNRAAIRKTAKGR